MRTNLILKAAIAACLLAVSSASFANTVTSTTSFSGIAGAFCTLTATSNGVMKQGLGVAGAGGDTVSFMGTQSGGGTRGTVTASCNGLGTLSVGPLVGVGAAAITYISSGKTQESQLHTTATGNTLISRNGTYTISGSGAIAVGINSVYYVEAYFDDNVSVSALPAGDYAVTVVTTLVSN